MENVFINIACGDVYVESWQNFDYVSRSPYVRRTDLLKGLPLATNSVDAAYCSHFLEHVPRHLVNPFLSECSRVLKSGGVLRLVLPDWEELSASYLYFRQHGEHAKAEFLLMEMIDQCVRLKKGGELGEFYRRLRAEPEKNSAMIEFVKERTGDNLEGACEGRAHVGWRRYWRRPSKIREALEWRFLLAVLAVLPASFRNQNVSVTGIGERHLWMYDFHTLQGLLRESGFVEIKRMSATTSAIPKFPFYPLDLTRGGSARKGAESMFVECIKR